jgi:hypothetical protein
MKKLPKDTLRRLHAEAERLEKGRLSPMAKKTLARGLQLVPEGMRDAVELVVLGQLGGELDFGEAAHRFAQKISKDTFKDWPRRKK